jgi:transposase-like protein
LAKKLARRGLHGVKLVISDAHEGLKAWQRCRVHFMRTARAHANKTAAASYRLSSPPRSHRTRRPPQAKQWQSRRVAAQSQQMRITL